MRCLLFLMMGLLPLCLLAQEKPYLITGKLEGANGSKIYLVSETQNFPFDSATIRQGRFILKGKAKANLLHALFLQGNQEPLILFFDGTPVQIEGVAAQFPVVKLKGNKDSEAMQVFLGSFQPLSKKALALNNAARTVSNTDSVAIMQLNQRILSLNEEVIRVGKAFVKDHPDAIASIIVMMNELQPRISPFDLEALYNTLTPQLKQSAYGKSMAAYIAEAKVNAVGTMAVDFTQNDTTGKPVRLSSFRGKYVLVDFWASWCGPCRQENPHVVSAYQQFKDKNFTILSVSLDSNRDNWLRAIAQDQLTWTHVSDLKGWNNAVAVKYKVYSIPQNFLVGPDGRIMAKNLRGEALQQILSNLLK